jgi:hypothetical protein
VIKIGTIPIIRRPYRDSFYWREIMQGLANKSCVLSVVFILLASPVIAHGGVIYVDHDGPANFNNIQAAINYANDGDTVIIADGTYTGEGNRPFWLSPSGRR